MKQVKLEFLPGNECWVRGEYRPCYITRVVLEEDEVTYEWANYDRGVDCTELWNDGYFTDEDIDILVFHSLEELEEAYPEDFNQEPGDDDLD